MPCSLHGGHLTASAHCTAHATFDGTHRLFGPNGRAFSFCSQSLCASCTLKTSHICCSAEKRRRDRPPWRGALCQRSTEAQGVANKIWSHHRARSVNTSIHSYTVVQTEPKMVNIYEFHPDRTAVVTKIPYKGNANLKLAAQVMVGAACLYFY